MRERRKQINATAALNLKRYVGRKNIMHDDYQVEDDSKVSTGC